MKGWKYVGAFMAGIIICGGASFLIARGSGAKLNADLSKARSDNASLRTSLDKSVRDVTDLTADLRFVHGQLDTANSLASGQQRTIGHQQQIIDATKRGLAGIAATISGTGGDVRKQIHAFADGFKRLYLIYHPGGK